MSVENWTEKTKASTTTKEVSGLTFVGSCVRVFHVDFAKGSDAVAMPIEAIDCAEIPQLWDVHPNDEWMYVTNMSTQSEGALSQIVYVNYTRIEDPFLQEPEESWTFNETEEQIDKDKDNLAIENSAGEPFDPPISETYSDGVYRCVRNEEFFDVKFAQNYKNSVNSDDFMGFPAGTCLLKVYNSAKAKVADIFYYKVTYEIHFRYDASNEQASGWKRRILDQGYRTKTGTVYEIIKDKDDNPLSQPVKLDGNGAKLADSADPFFLEFDTKKQRNFGALNLEA